jgi:peptidoglycan-associated lipoprotein
MKQASCMIFGISVLLSTAACAHKTPIASRPPDPTPVATVAPVQPVQRTPVPTQTVATAPVRQQPVVQAKQNAAMPEKLRTSLNEKLARLEDALFDFNQSTIRADATVALRDDVGVIRDILADYPSQKLTIEGHADERGSAEYNLALGDRRAQAVQEFLNTMGIPASQLTVISYGKEKPVCTESSEDCWQKNRRAHVTAAAQ